MKMARSHVSIYTISVCIRFFYSCLFVLVEDVSGSNFLLNSDYVYDMNAKTVEPVEEIKYGEIVFVISDLLNEFFERIYPRLKTKIILMSHQGDTPTFESQLKFLFNDTKLIVWFAQNPGFVHKKHVPIPIGFGKLGLSNTFFSIKCI